jgi:hypothetical protein
MLDRLAKSVAPRNIIEWLWVKDFADISWEIARLRRYRAQLSRAMENCPLGAMRNCPLLG